jgi:hypothetical protein
MLLQHIDWKYLVAGIVVGIIAQFVIKPEQKTIVRYPEPSKADSLTFRDSNNTCFKFKASEVECNTNEGNLLDFPLQN